MNQASRCDAFIASTIFTITSDDVAPPQQRDLPTSAAIFSNGAFKTKAGFLATMSEAAYVLQAVGDQGLPGEGAEFTARQDALTAVAGQLQLLDASNLTIAGSGWTFSNGFFINGNAAALVGKSANGLFVAIRGTNDDPDGDFLNDLFGDDGHDARSERWRVARQGPRALECSVS